MRIRTQLILLVLIPLCCALAAAGGTVYLKRQESLTAGGVAQLAPLAEELRDFIRFLEEPPPGSGRTAQYHLQAARNRIGSLPAAPSPKVSSPAEQALLAKIQQLPGQLRLQLDQSVRGSSILSSRGATLLTGEINKGLVLLDQLETLYSKTLQQERSRISRLNLLLLAVAAFWPLPLALLLYRNLALPLRKLQDAVAALTRGELGHRVGGQAAGELGRLVVSFNKMAEARQKAESAARAAEEQNRELLDTLQNLVVCLDSNGAVNYCNDYLLKVIDRPRHDIIGKNWFDLCLPDPEPVKQVFRMMISQGEITYHYRNEILTRTGARRLVAWSNTLRHDSEGGVIGTTSIGSDITEQTAAETALDRSRQILRSLIDGLPESLSLTNRSGTVLTANSTFAKRANKDPDQINGCTLKELFGADIAQERMARINEVFASGSPQTFSDTKGLWLYEHHLYPVQRQDGSVESVAMLSVDITDKQRIDEELQQANQQLRSSNELLEQRVAERTAELTKLNRALELARDTAAEASRSKTEFLANMSHEIRTPMNAILGLTHLTLQTRLSPKQQEYLTSINNSAQSLLGIINDILDVSRIEAGNLQMEQIEFSLDEVLRRAVTLLAMKARSKGLSLEQQRDPDLPDYLVGDPLRLEQVLANLLGNAVKFTEQGSITLRIGLSPNRHTENQVELAVTVSDTGIGMDEITISRLFRPFSQGDTSTTRPHGGTGLGLTICRHLVELMGGDITVSSRPGSGSSFSFTARFGQGSASGSTARCTDRYRLVRQYQTLTGLHLLVVEDHPVNRLITQELLEAVGVQVDTADNGREAVDFMRDHGEDIDLVLMDIQMPVMDGYDATREIRRRYSRNRLPIVAMTAHALAEEREQCLAAGMNEHLPKPVAVDRLYELVARLTNRPAAADKDSAFFGPTEQSDRFPERLPGINLEAALVRVNGNRPLLLQLVRLFAQEQRGTFEEIRRLLAEGDLTTAARLVHGLKGVAGNLAAERLHAAAVNIEMPLKNNDRSAAEALLPLLDGALQELLVTAATVQTPVTAPAEQLPSGAPAEIGRLMSTLQHLLEVHSLEVNEPLERLRTLLPPGDARSNLEALCDAIQRLDYQQGLMLLHSLAEKIDAREEDR